MSGIGEHSLFYLVGFFHSRNNRKGGTTSLRSRTCIKRNAVYGARFKVFSLSKWESNTYQNGFGYISDTYPNPYPLGTLMIILTFTSQKTNNRNGVATEGQQDEPFCFVKKQSRQNPPLLGTSGPNSEANPSLGCLRMFQQEWCKKSGRKWLK